MAFTQKIPVVDDLKGKVNQFTNPNKQSRSISCYCLNLLRNFQQNDWVRDGVEDLAFLGIGEHNRAQQRSVDAAIGLKNAGPKCSDQFLQGNN